MTVLWMYHPKSPTHTQPNILSQVATVTELTLQLRNPKVINSILLGKIYTGMTLVLAIAIYTIYLDSNMSYETHPEHSIRTLLAPLLFAPFLVHRLFVIRKLSDIYLNRTTQKLYYQGLRKLLVLDWHTIRGGVFVSNDFGGICISTSYALAIAPCRADGSAHREDGFWVDGNKPGGTDAEYVAEVWEYLRHFMDHGPKKLPRPAEPSWWFLPLHKVYLTPAEAWKHYVPWRTGEQGEERGKKTWLLPYWAVLLPYNLAVAICWYLICRAFNVEAAPPPHGALTATPTRARAKTQ